MNVFVQNYHTGNMWPSEIPAYESSTRCSDANKEELWDSAARVCLLQVNPTMSDAQ